MQGVRRGTRSGGSRRMSMTRATTRRSVVSVVSTRGNRRSLVPCSSRSSWAAGRSRSCRVFAGVARPRRRRPPLRRGARRPGCTGPRPRSALLVGAADRGRPFSKACRRRHCRRAPAGVQLAGPYLPGTAELEVGGDWYHAIVLNPTDGLGPRLVGDVVSGKGLRQRRRWGSSATRIPGVSLRPAEAHDDLLGRLSRLVEEVIVDLPFATVVTPSSIQ